jgi:cytochrome P450
MKPAIMHLVVRDTYSDGLRIMAVTTAKARRFWGRDVSSEVPMNVSAGQVLATFTGPEGEAKAKAIRPAIEALNKVLRAKNRVALEAEREARRKAQEEFDAAVKAEVAKVQTS